MTSIQDMIRKKRDGEVLSPEEIQDFIWAVSTKTIQESQIGAMLMAVYLRGMETEEVRTLTQAMMESGEVLRWPEDWSDRVVDKHSTGGVGDKVSLVLAPALAACGCKVPMISGRGLAHTGGTLDKLESIPGFNINQSAKQIHHILESVGCCIVGQTETLVPADRVLYALRDATSTVDSLPLITGSIVSKKGAESLTALVLDVKFGRAALYKDLESAKELAQELMATGNGLGIRTGAALSRMDAPIGRMVGNSLEVLEALETLKGRGPPDLMELVTALGGVLLQMTGLATDQSEGSKKIYQAVVGGEALATFQAMMEAQGVANKTACSLCSAHSDYFKVLRKSKFQRELTSDTEGFIESVDGLVIAQVLHKLGAGRSKAGEPVNHSVGAELLVAPGQEIKKGTAWLRLHYEDLVPSSDQLTVLQNSLRVGLEPQTQQDLIQELLLPD